MYALTLSNGTAPYLDRADRSRLAAKQRATANAIAEADAYEAHLDAERRAQIRLLLRAQDRQLIAERDRKIASGAIR